MHAIVGAAVLDDESAKVLRDTEAAALEAFRTGTATKQSWNDINAAVSIAESMAAAGIGPEVLIHVKIAEMHLRDARDRFVRIGKMGTTGPGLQSFKDILEYHELQRTSIARNVYEQHIEKVTNMIRSKSPKIIFL
jgi:hypothetical protein